MLASLGAALGLVARAAPEPPRMRRPTARGGGAEFDRQPPRVRYVSGGASRGPMNGGRECERRRRQMARGDVLNWYPGQVRANWRD